jgi:hypothetical protein
VRVRIRGRSIQQLDCDRDRALIDLHLDTLRTARSTEEAHSTDPAPDRPAPVTTVPSSAASRPDPAPRHERHARPVIVEAELDALSRHKRGEDVAEVMAAFDAAAKATIGERDDAVQTVTALFTRDLRARRAKAEAR